MRDPREGRGGRVEEPKEGKMDGTSSPKDISTRLERIAELSRNHPAMVLTTLSHHIDLPWMREAYRRTRKDGATGVDGETAEAFARDLEARLQALVDGLKSGKYKAPPVRRTYIPKGDGRQRPLGIPSFEDKVLQRAVAMVLSAVYEPVFHGFSYGFRPGRSAHDALRALRAQMLQVGGGWVLEVDIEGFFDNVDHGHLRDFLDKKVRDGVLRRVIGKWLSAGVMEEGKHLQPSTGTPQGGVISPLLANIYLHEVVDEWFVHQVRPRLSGTAHLVRYADDFVLVFEREEDARRVLAVLPKRLNEFGLRMHPDKTRLLPFGRPGAGGDPPTFDFLGFTHYWGRTRKGGWTIKRKTAAQRQSRALRAVNAWCRTHRHLPIAAQHRMLCQKVRGHVGYYLIVSNTRAVQCFVRSVERIWRKWLGRRHRKGRIPWERFGPLLRAWPMPRLPAPDPARA